ncbi:MAG: hypothetical protein IE913_08580 [Halothiobacillus sp.]|nr:hypothetical protein [Halothiobacillus sp.]
MSYLVLARKWRPKSFAEMVGQGHVLRALTNALDQSRLHHAYLFTGTRGVGKTTVARIFAKALNCERGISSTPCGVCSACVWQPPIRKSYLSRFCRVVCSSICVPCRFPRFNSIWPMFCKRKT